MPRLVELAKSLFKYESGWNEISGIIQGHPQRYRISMAGDLLARYAMNTVQGLAVLTIPLSDAAERGDWLEVIVDVATILATTEAIKAGVHYGARGLDYLTIRKQASSNVKLV